MDMSLEELQLLLRMHQQGMDPTGTVDVSETKHGVFLSAKREKKHHKVNWIGTDSAHFTEQPFNSNLPLSEWNFTDVEANLKSVSNWPGTL